MLRFYTFEQYKKRLSDAGLLVSACGTYEKEIKNLCCDSKKAAAETMFVCKGNHFKPEYLDGAVSAGAICYVSEKEYGADVSHLIVSDVRAALAELSDMYYNSPWKKLNILGVTGTKGKTTVTHFIKALLDAHFRDHGMPDCGLVSTVETYDGKESAESVNSTPESIDLQRILLSCAENGLNTVSCEVSSQALKYHRVRCIEFDTGVFLNIGEDHISPVEHPDMEDYFSSKLKLFSQCGKAVINRGSDMYGRIYEAASKCEKVVTFGKTPDCDVYVSNIRKENGKTVFTAKTPQYEAELRLGMAGFFNAENAAAAIAATLDYNIPAQTAVNVFENIAVSGRMETYSSPDGKVTAIVDYAHNAMSFETLFSHVLKEYPGRRIVSVFGSVGNKAEVRRYALGKIAGKYSDYVYITSEHPDYEDPNDIAAQIASGIKEGKSDYRVIVDRETAVETAVREAPDNTVVLILGVGDETTQRINGVLYERRSDSECVLSALKERYNIPV